MKIEREEASESTRSTSKRRKARTPRKKGRRGSRSSADDESVSTARASTPRKRRPRTPKRKPEPPPKQLLPWGLSSAENPIERPMHEKKAVSPPTILQYNSSHSSLLGHPVHRCSPPSSRHHHHHHKKHKHSFKEAGVSESYLDHQIQLSIGGPKSTTMKVIKARDSIRESRKAMKEQDKERRSTQKFSNPVTPKYLKPKYAIPPELQVRRESDDDISQSSKSARTEPPSAFSEMSSGSASTKSDGAVYASGKTKKKKKKRSTKRSKGKRKAGYRKERPPPEPERSESYMDIMNQYAIAGRKVRRKTSPEILEKVENVGAFTSFSIAYQATRGTRHWAAHSANFR
ncbi:hypothetical protein OESDEN_21794 [Oesophagostomum dentatum]|uniref:Uncharacterized protein n=1 Tax=Oesophagostomum dentatum TaxID=61180 RepID=A0A0B1RZR0_OESDE|nr:hypothetical protein OESDEN_21794 [Oesophagostomum dentatum]